MNTKHCIYCLVISLALAVAACSDEDDSDSAASNGTTATSNGTTATSNGTTATSNGTTATSNGTTAISNGTAFNPDDAMTVELDSGAKVVVYDFGDMQLHNYNDNPENGVGNSTYIIESANNLVLIDSQFIPDSATDFRTYADTLGKPIDRILLTHGHPDHVSGLAVAFSDIPSYSSAGVIAEALEDSGSEIANEIEGTMQIDGITYNVEVRQNLEASEQLIITLPDYGVVSLGDLLYNGWHAVMNPGFDGWIAALEEFEAMDDVNMFLAGHGPAGVSSEEVGQAIAYLQTGKNAFMNSTTAEEFMTAMFEAYPDHLGPFLLSIGANELLFPPPSFEVDFGDCTELAMGVVAPLTSLQDQVPEGVTVLNLTEQGTVFEGSDDLGVLIARVVACDSIAATDGSESQVDEMVHFAHVGTPVDVSTFPATPYNTDGNNGADFNNYIFAYHTDSPAYLGAMQGAGVVGASSADITLVDTPAGDCMVDRQVSVAGGAFAFEASGTVPDASCEDPVVPFVGNWWSVENGSASVLSNNIPGQAAVFIDVMTTTVTIQASASDSQLAAVIGADPTTVGAFALTGFLPETDGVDMVIEVVGEIGE